MPLNMNKSVACPGLENQQRQLPDPTELACVEVPKVFDQCLIKRCLKYKDGPDTDKTDCELRSNALDCPKKYLGCRDFSVKMLSVELAPLKSCPGFQKVIICYVISFWADFMDENGCNKCELFEINRTEVIGKFYSPGPVAQISVSSPSGKCSVDFDPNFFKIELIADALCGEFEKDGKGSIVLDITLGYYLIVKYEFIVQLLIPAYDYCPVPKPPCREPLFIEEDVCELFERSKTPKFYPDQNLEPLFNDRDRDYDKRENDIRHSDGRDFGNKDFDIRDFGNKDFGGRDYGNKDFGGRDYGNKDFGGKDCCMKEETCKNF